MKKILALVLVLGLFFAGNVFAQQGKGYIMPTFGFGFGSMKPDQGKSADVSGFVGTFDFVSSYGLALGFQVINGVADFGSGGGKMAGSFSSVGVGYTYDGGNWSLGGKFMTSANDGDEKLLNGLNINGTYWIVPDIGITGMFDYRGNSDWKLNVFSVGVSLKI